MRVVKFNNEVYVEFTSVKDTVKTAAKFAAFAVISVVSFFALWVLLEFLR